MVMQCVIFLRWIRMILISRYFISCFSVCCTFIPCTFLPCIFLLFSTMKCIRKLRLEEDICDVAFECEGDLLSVTQQSSGTCLYRTDTCLPVAQCILQSRY